MSPQQAAFVARRRAQIAYWPWLGGGLILLLVLAYGFWLWRYPLMANPLHLVTELNARRLEEPLVAQIAVYGSLAFAGCAAFILTLLLFPFAALNNERRLLAIIDAQQAQLNAASPDPAAVDAALLQDQGSEAGHEQP